MAVENGSIDLLKWGFDQGFVHLTEDVMRCAVQSDQLDVVRWLIKSGCPWCSDVNLGHFNLPFIPLYEYFYHPPPLPEHVLSREDIKLLIEHGCSMGKNTMYWIASSGDLDLFQWVIRRGIPCSSADLASASMNGHIEILKWALTDGRVVIDDEYSVYQAMCCGRIDVVKYLTRDAPNASWHGLSDLDDGGHDEYDPNFWACVKWALQDPTCPDGLKEYLREYYDEDGMLKRE